MLQADHQRTSGTFVDQNVQQNEASSIYAFTPALWIAAILIASGLFHLSILIFEGADWKGALSPRKPGLFGVSSGLTVWSIAWLITQLSPLRFDRVFANLLAGSLLIEVGLITLQYWRGVPSHFNRATPLDAIIEATMLALILLVTALILYLTLRTFRLRAIDGAMAFAIRGGMWLLVVSCGLGIFTSILGDVNIANDKSYETWGKAGVLKFPHGVALHAIQLLPFFSWLMQRLRMPNSIRLIQSLFASQVIFLAYAVRQTVFGRDRFDWDLNGALLLVVSVLLGIYPVSAIARAIFASALASFKEPSQEGIEI